MKHISLSVLLFLACLLLITSCSDTHASRHKIYQKWMEHNGKVKVLSTTAMIDDLVKNIGGDDIDSITLIQGELDPHSYQLVKGDDEKLSFAQIIFANGLGLEHGPSLQRYLRQSEKTFSLGDLIYRQDPSMIIDIQGQKDPHIWMDISLWSQAIPFIVKALSQKDPAHAQSFQERGAQLQAQLSKAHRETKKIMHEVPSDKRYLVTSHDAFNYFTRAYLAEENELANGSWQKRFVAPEGLAPESQLSSADIRAIIDHLQRYQIHVLFPESNVSRDSIKKIVQAGREKGLELRIACCPLYADAIGPKGSEGDTYLGMLAYDAKIISYHLNRAHMAEEHGHH